MTKHHFSLTIPQGAFEAGSDRAEMDATFTIRLANGHHLYAGRAGETQRVKDGLGQIRWAEINETTKQGSALVVRGTWM